MAEYTDPAKWTNPVDSGTITSGYGPRIHPVFKTRKNHNGIDFGVNVGTPIKAAADGIAERRIQGGGKTGAGYYIIIDHGKDSSGNKYQTRYMHLSSFAIPEGSTRVKQGQIIGYSGGAKGAVGSGTSTGPHLHYEVLKNDKKLDPKPYLNGQGGTIPPSYSPTTPDGQPVVQPDTPASSNPEQYSVQDTYLDQIYPNRGSYFGRLAQNIYTIMTYGDPGVKAGDVIMINMPLGRPTDDPTLAQANPWISGFFLVGTVKHIITQSTYITIMDVYKNSFAAQHFFTDHAEQEKIDNGVPHLVNKYSKNQGVDPAKENAQPADPTDPKQQEVNSASPAALTKLVPPTTLV